MTHRVGSSIVIVVDQPDDFFCVIVFVEKTELMRFRDMSRWSSHFGAFFASNLGGNIGAEKDFEADFREGQFVAGQTTLYA